MQKQQNKKFDLFSEFSPVNRKQWEDQIKKDLNGDDYRKLLDWETLEGFRAAPFYTRKDIEHIPERDFTIDRSQTGWLCCEPVYPESPADANKAILSAIKAGADSILIKTESTPDKDFLRNDQAGIQIQSQDDFSTVLLNVDLTKTSLFFNSGMLTPAFIAMLKNHGAESTNAAFLFDPFTYVAAYGKEPLPEPDLNQRIADLTSEGRWKTISADGYFYHKAGASIIQELAFSLSIASEYLVRTEDPADQKIAGSFFMRLSAGPLYFPEIAKFRAIRLLWQRLLDAYKVKPVPLFIHAETSSQNKSITDPHNNILRLTTEAMAAVTGGADSLTIHPFDSHYSEPDAFSRRISRNIHHILQHEAHLAKVADPAAGSYYVEHLTETIAIESWELFRMIEKQGGFLKALRSRIIQSEISNSRSGKERAYATQKKILIGTNKYPNPKESLPETPFRDSKPAASLSGSKNLFKPEPGSLVLSIQKFLKEKGLLEDVVSELIKPGMTFYTTLEEYNAADVFDRIRLKTTLNKKETGHTPAVTLLPVGSRKWRNARASFSQHIFGCTGFEIRQLNGFDSLEEARSILKSTTSEICVLCSSDDEYDSLVPAFCEIMKNRDTILILAGNPGGKESIYRDSGIGYFIESGMNLPETLGDIQQKLFKPEQKL